ncbi:LacI family DNA-binding transcriptional regulator [Tahibacter amnicola]|uniref:LacI family transcriptional regulator n=1 Tax=Tahibacter amnicola TaxID=2976241 RepID=A0ABY6B957_9GAMM|nr:LacI family DNA-binding transcriptional regulator [Tahibacter amnicola]UXI66404.1 LacI family transcriptional regulator [Tahibacter amnicola]
MSMDQPANPGDNSARSIAPGRRPGKPATINDIARMAGVSKKTVSRVINRSQLVQQQTRERVEALIRDIGYVPDPMARALAFGKSFLVGLLYDSNAMQDIPLLQEGLVSGLRGSAFAAVLHGCDSRREDPISSIRQFIIQRRPHGVIFAPPLSDLPELGALAEELGCRHVRIQAEPVDASSSAMLTQDRSGAAEVADYLVSLGHRRIGFIAGPESLASARERSAGFLERLGLRGVQVADEHLVSADYGFDAALRGATRLLRDPSRPSAIFAASDEMAAAVLKAARTLGIDVPGEVSVVGFGDSAISRLLSPALTSVHSPLCEIAGQAVSMLIGGEADMDAVSSPRVVERESCRRL